MIFVKFATQEQYLEQKFNIEPRNREVTKYITSGTVGSHTIRKQNSHTRDMENKLPNFPQQVLSEQ
jgi:hypothetical protein